MTTLNREEMIEAMADAIDVIADNHISTIGKLNCGSFAEAALDALIDILPKLDKFDYKNPEYYAEYYKQLLSLRNK